MDGLGLLFILIWSSGYVVGALATEVMPPLTVTLWRFVVAGAVLAALALYRRERWPHGWALVRVVGAGIPMFAIQFGALYTALSEGMPAATTALVACSSPLLVAALGAVIGWERLSPMNWVGIGLGVVGVVVTLSDRVGRPPSLGVLAWTLLGLAGLVVGTLVQPRLRADAGPMSVAALQVIAGAVVLAVWAPEKGTLAMPFTVHGVSTFLWLSLVTGVGAPLLMFALIRRRGATAASSLLFVVPAVTAFAAWPLLGTKVGALAVVGLVIAAAGMVLAGRRRPTPTTTAEPAPLNAGLAREAA